MPTSRDLQAIRRLLVAKRKSLLTTQKAAAIEAAELKGLQESEYEETAQVELAHFTLSHLVESRGREVEQVDAALQRLEEGSFGICVDCGGEIPIERLKALPFALRCEEDASMREMEQRGVSLAPSL